MNDPRPAPLCMCHPLGTRMVDQGAISLPTNVEFAGQKLRRDFPLEIYRCPKCTRVDFFAPKDLKGSLAQ